MNVSEIDCPIAGLDLRWVEVDSSQCVAEAHVAGSSGSHGSSSHVVLLLLMLVFGDICTSILTYERDTVREHSTLTN